MKKFFVGVIIIVVLLGARSLDSNLFSKTEMQAHPEVDYAEGENWLSLPEESDKEVDVFYAYPTVWQKKDESDPNICGIDNLSMHKGAKRSLVAQASCFEEIGNIYAPYYRQVDGSYGLSLEHGELQELIEEVPGKDLKAAFDYYIKNYNEGRPFIIAGHSQGSHALLEVLSEYFRNSPEVGEKMVAAYIIGYSVTDEYLGENPHLQFAEGRCDTGVIVSYNTEAEQVGGKNPVVLEGAIAINPISWERDESLAAADKSLGARFFKDGVFQKLEAFSDARVDKKRGVVISSTADPEEFFKPIFGLEKGIYHIWDYCFYYYDLKQNAADRTDAYFELKKLP